MLSPLRYTIGPIGADVLLNIENPEVISPISQMNPEAFFNALSLAIR